MAFSVTPCRPVGASNSLYSLKWNHYQSCMTSGLAALLDDEEYSMTDVTLACEGQFIQAHKIALAVSSPFFKEFFKINRIGKAGITLIALANLKFQDLKNIIQFIYNGEISVSNEEISSFLKAASLLQIQGLRESHETNQPIQDEIPKFDRSNCTSTTTPPFVIQNVANSSQTLSSSASVGVEPTIPLKRSRLSAPVSCSSSVTSIPQVEARIQIPASKVPLPPSSLDEYSMMDNENEEEEEEMISMDMKQEPIAVYSMSDNIQEYGDGDTNTTTAEGVAGDDNSGLEFHDFNYSDHLLNQTSESDRPSGTSGPGRKKGRPNPTGMRRRNDSSITFTVQPQPNDTAQNQNQHGIGGTYFDSQHQASRFSCLCGVTFSKNSSLKRHINEIVTSGSLKCDACGKGFFRERNLRRHQRQSKTCSLLVLD